tara:strand:- start:2076 stop:3032 length:957 start_codon:yes stop_codon:yes gene_type:complete
MDKLLLVGTGSSVFHNKDLLKEYFKPGRDRDVKLLAYSNSIEMFLEEDISFDYWFFIDPTSAFKAVDMINEKFSKENKAPFTFITPYGDEAMPTKNIEMQFFGGNNPDYSKDGYKTYDDFIKETKELSKYKIEKTIEIPMTTQKFIYNNVGHPLRRFDLDREDAYLRFKNELNKVIMGSGEVGNRGMEIILEYHQNHNVENDFVLRYINNFKNPSFGMMNMCENKLTMCALPVSQFLNTKNVYVLGFDGKGGRWDDLDDDCGVLEDSVLNGYYLNKWMNWEEYSKMKIYSVTQDEYTDNNVFLPYVELDKLLNKGSNI